MTGQFGGSAQLSAHFNMADQNNASDNFEKWKVPELREFLMQRNVPVTNQNKDILVQNCNAALLLGLQPTKSETLYVKEIEDSRQNKLVLDGGVIRLPDPDSLLSGWDDAPTSFPDLIQSSVENYFDRKNKAIQIKTGGKKSLRDGKSLHISGHVTSLFYHGVGANVPYCLMKAAVIRETNISLQPYNCWIIVRKEKRLAIDGYCSCPAGLRGTCKHVASLCHTVIEKVARGENQTVTQQRQTWHAPSQKNHLPEFLEDIHIQKVKGSCVIEEAVSRSRRFSFDPRAIVQRQRRNIHDLDLEGLREATNGSSGILCYLPPDPDLQHQDPEISNCAVLTEVVVTEDETSAMPSASLPPTLIELSSMSSSSECFYEAATKPLDPHVVQAVSECTKAQAESDNWHKYRIGRVTASRALQVYRKVIKGISQRNDSLLKAVMNYGPPVYSPAIHWGNYNEEKYAVQKFYKLNRRKHKSMAVEGCGVILCAFNPVLAASPDALVTCKCCGTRPLEVKNPYKHRNLSVHKLAEQPVSCLHVTATGRLELKATHDYYYQVQVQLLATSAEVGYFCLQTASKYNNFHCEEICFDPILMEDVVEKAILAFKSIIMPELLLEYLKHRLELSQPKDVTTNQANAHLPCLPATLRARQLQRDESNLKRRPWHSLALFVTGSASTNQKRSKTLDGDSVVGLST